MALHVERSHTYERMFLAEMFLRPVVAHEAANEYRLSERHFTITAHAWLFRVLGLLNEREYLEGGPPVRARTIEALNRLDGRPWPTKTDPLCIDEVLHLGFPDGQHGFEAGDFAYAIVEMHDRRDKARQWMKTAREMLEEVILRPEPDDENVGTQPAGWRTESAD